MIGDTFTVGEAVSKGGSWLLAVSLDAVSSIPHSIFLLLLGVLVVVFLMIAVFFGGKVKWILRRFF